MSAPILVKFLSFTFLIVQQPVGNFLYFKMEPEYMTQASHVWSGFCPASEIGNIVLLAEQSPVVAGMAMGDRLEIKFKDGSAKTFVVLGTDYYHQTGWINPSGAFWSMQDGNKYEANRIVYDMYCHFPLTIQTCYDGIRGRLFVHAVPMETWRRWENMQ